MLNIFTVAFFGHRYVDNIIKVENLLEEQIRRLGKARILEIAKTFCEIIEKAGYTYGTYSNKTWFTDYLTDAWYDTKVKWLAQYYKEVTYKGSYDIWQYTDRGRVDGIEGRVDLNISFIDLTPEEE